MQARWSHDDLRPRSVERTNLDAEIGGCALADAVVFDSGQLGEALDLGLCLAAVINLEGLRV